MQPSPGITAEGSPSESGSLPPDEFGSFERDFAQIDQDAMAQELAAENEYKAAVEAVMLDLQERKAKHEAALQEDLTKSRQAYEVLLQDLLTHRVNALTKEHENKAKIRKQITQQKKSRLYLKHPNAVLHMRSPGPSHQARPSNSADAASPAYTAASSPTLLNGESHDNSGQAAELPRSTEKRKAGDSVAPETSKRLREDHAPDIQNAKPSDEGTSTRAGSQESDIAEIVVASQSHTPARDIAPEKNSPKIARKNSTGNKQQRSMSFAEVYCKGKPKYYHHITEFPAGSGKWYILKCDEHGVHFGENPVFGAAKHLTGSQHGLSKQHHTAIEHLGILIQDCTKELADKNNEMVRAHFAKGNKPFNFNFLTKKERLAVEMPPAGTPSRKSHKPAVSNNTKSSPQSATKQTKEFKGVISPEPSQLYLGYWTVNARWYPIIVLPWKELRMRVTAEDGKNVSKIWMQPDLLLQAPPCYVIDKTKQRISGWAPGYEDGGRNVAKRKFPVVFQDSSNSVAWLAAEHITPFDAENNQATVKKRNLIRTQDWFAQRLGFASYEEKIMMESVEGDAPATSRGPSANRQSSEELPTEIQAPEATATTGRQDATLTGDGVAHIDVPMAEAPTAASDPMDMEAAPSSVAAQVPIRPTNPLDEALNVKKSQSSSLQAMEVRRGAPGRENEVASKPTTPGATTEKAPAAAARGIPSTPTLKISTQTSSVAQPEGQRETPTPRPITPAKGKKSVALADILTDDISPLRAAAVAALNRSGEVIKPVSSLSQSDVVERLPNTDSEAARSQPQHSLPTRDGPPASTAMRSGPLRVVHSLPPKDSASVVQNNPSDSGHRMPTQTGVAPEAFSLPPRPGSSSGRGSTERSGQGKASAAPRPPQPTASATKVFSDGPDHQQTAHRPPAPQSNEATAATAAPPLARGPETQNREKAAPVAQEANEAVSVQAENSSNVEGGDGAANEPHPATAADTTIQPSAAGMSSATTSYDGAEARSWSRPMEDTSSKGSQSPAPQFNREFSYAAEKEQTYAISRFSRKSAEGQDKERFQAQGEEYLQLVVQSDRPEVAESAPGSAVKILIDPLELVEVMVSYEGDLEAVVRLRKAPTAANGGGDEEWLRFPNQPSVGRAGKVQGRKFCAWVIKVNRKLNIKKF